MRIFESAISCQGAFLTITFIATTSIKLASEIPNHIPAILIFNTKQNRAARGMPKPYANVSVILVFFFYNPSALTTPFYTPFIVLKNIYRKRDQNTPTVVVARFSSVVKMCESLSAYVENTRIIITVMHTL